MLLRVQSADIAGAYSDYQKAVADEQLTRTQLERAQLLYDKGAISLNDLQVAQDTDAKAKVDVKTTAEKLRVLGSPNLDQPTGIVDIRAPVSGVITDQQVTNAAGVAGLGSPNPFTISDLSYVWILCDVYENDLSNVHLGEKADIRSECLSGQGVHRNDQQHRTGAGSEHPNGEGAHRGAQSRLDAPGHVRDGNLSRSEERDTHGCSRNRDPASARP